MDTSVEQVGADGLRLLPDMVYKADRRETVASYRSVAIATPLPILCYDNPKGYGVDLTPELLLELADVENIEAIKEASGDPRRLTDLVNIGEERERVLKIIHTAIETRRELGALTAIDALANQ